MQYYDALIGWVRYAVNGSWRWFNSLDREEWLIVLAVTTVLGFLCMRGFGSRNNY